MHKTWYTEYAKWLFWSRYNLSALRPMGCGQHAIMCAICFTLEGRFCQRFSCTKSNRLKSGSKASLQKLSMSFTSFNLFITFPFRPFINPNCKQLLHSFLLFAALVIRSEMCCKQTSHGRVNARYYMAVRSGRFYIQALKVVFHCMYNWLAIFNKLLSTDQSPPKRPFSGSLRQSGRHVSKTTAEHLPEGLKGTPHRAAHL